MSNLSNIGFNVDNEDDFYALVESVTDKSEQIKTKQGNYYKFSDKSGAELWIQVDNDKELIGVNPHFNGKSKRNVSLTSSINKEESILDGSFYAWAEPINADNPESGEYPFVFDVPNHKVYSNIELPQILNIQLSAFAQECEYYDSEDTFYDSQDKEFQFASQSFIPSGLFNVDEEADPKPPQAFGMLSGIIKESEKKKNDFTGEEFYWFLVDTLGGEIDVVADIQYFDDIEPCVGGIIQGQFWLSAVLHDPKLLQTPKQ